MEIVTLLSPNKEVKRRVYINSDAPTLPGVGTNHTAV